MNGEDDTITYKTLRSAFVFRAVSRRKRVGLCYVYLSDEASQVEQPALVGGFVERCSV